MKIGGGVYRPFESRKNFVRYSFSQTDNFTVDFVNKPKKNIKHKILSLFKKDKTVKLVSDEQNEFLKKDLKLDLHIKHGDTFGVGNTLFINNDGKLERLNMTPKCYSVIFPQKPKQCSQSKQIGDCWLIATINGLLRKPKGKIGILRTLGQADNDLYVKLPSMSVFFKNGKPIKSKTGANLKGADGLQIIEEAVAMKRTKGATIDALHTSRVLGIDTLMRALNKGAQAEALHQFFPDIKPKIIYRNKKQQKQILKNSSNKNNVFIGISTESYEMSSKEKDINKLYPRHSYSINSYNKENKQVELQDPYKPNKPFFMNIDELMEYPFTLTYAKLK